MLAKLRQQVVEDHSAEEIVLSAEQELHGWWGGCLRVGGFTFRSGNSFVWSQWVDAIVAGEVSWVIRENLCNAVHLHGCSNSGVVNLNSAYLILNDHLAPLCVNERGIVKDGKNGIKPVEPILSLIGCQASLGVRPSPFLSAGRVHTFQNSAIFCGRTHSGSSAARKDLMAFKEASPKGCPCWMLKINTLVSTRTATHQSRW